jgi:agmatinase
MVPELQGQQNMCSKPVCRLILFDPDMIDGWKQGFYMKPVDKKILLKSDYLRKEAELYIDYISNGDDVNQNRFMCKSLKDINEGSKFMNDLGV